MTEWISVEQRLPRTNEWVLIYVDTGDKRDGPGFKRKGYLSPHGWVGEGLGLIEGWRGWRVTHWKPQHA